MIELSKPAKRIVRRGMASIAMNPKAWDQREWVCNTQACLAGHIVINEDGLAGTLALSKLDQQLRLSVPSRALELLGLDRLEGPGEDFYHYVFGRTGGDDFNFNGHHTRKKTVEAYLAFARIVKEQTGIDCTSYAKLIPEDKEGSA